jgi:hypothetical protein
MSCVAKNEENKYVEENYGSWLLVDGKDIMRRGGNEADRGAYGEGETHVAVPRRSTKLGWETMVEELEGPTEARIGTPVTLTAESSSSFWSIVVRRESMGYVPAMTH